jgi:hypothetical protein
LFCYKISLFFAFEEFSLNKGKRECCKQKKIKYNMFLVKLSFVCVFVYANLSLKT